MSEFMYIYKKIAFSGTNPILILNKRESQTVNHIKGKKIRNCHELLRPPDVIPYIHICEGYQS